MYRIGVDIGGTTIKAGVVSNEGKILFKLTKATIKESENAFAKGIVEIIAEALKSTGLTYQDIEFIGIGCPGSVDSKKGIIYNATNLGINKYPLKEHLENILPIPILINNDANCAALGEYYFLGDMNISSFVMLTLGTGIGGGIILEHKIYEGYDGSAGEFGNIVMYNGNQRAMWENYASAQALVKLAEKAATENQESVLNTLIRKNGGKADGKIVFSALEQKDEVTEEIFRKYIKYLGDGIISIFYTLCPEVIAIGGGISQAAPLLEYLEEYISKNSNLMKRERKTRIYKAMLGNDAGIIGAASLKEYM